MARYGSAPLITPPPPSGVVLPRWTEWLVRFLDDGVGVPGTQIRFGADALVGLVLPVAGDALGALFSGALIVFAARKGAKNEVLWAIARNTALDTLFGSVPVLGDVFDLKFKANRRNLALLKASLAGESAVEPTRALRATALFLLVGILVVCVALPLIASALLLAWLFGRA